MSSKEKPLYEQSVIEADGVDTLNLEIDPKDERKFLIKMDFRLMPLFCMMFFFSYLTRSNLGNAKIAGLMEDLHLTESQFSTASSVLYSTYITAQIPGVLLMKKFKAKANWYLGLMMVCFSLVTLFAVFLQNFGGLVAHRVLIGLFEGSFFSCMSVYISDCYFPHELGKRFAYLFSASAISSSFGGLIGTGITQIDSGPLAKWRYLYLIEGLLNFVAALVVIWKLPPDASTIFKTEKEQEIFRIREIKKKQFMGNEEFKFKNVLQCFKSVKTYTSFVIQFCQDICMYGFTTFLPSILKLGLGYNSLQAQYLTIPVYVLAGIILIIAAALADRWRTRGPLIMFLNLFSIAGYSVILGCENSSLKYFGCFLITVSLFSNVSLNESWLAVNSAPADRRAASIGANQTFGNAAGIIAPLVYRSAPYTLGHAFSLGCMVVAVLVALAQHLMFRRTNTKRSLLLDTADDEEIEIAKGDLSVTYKFIT